MTTRTYFRIAFNIVLLFGLPMLATFLSDWLNAVGFFGDQVCTRTDKHYHAGVPCDGVLWGARHYWYVWGCFFLWLVGLVRVGAVLVNAVDGKKN